VSTEPFPPPAQLTSHQPPALLVEALLHAAADGSAARARLINTHGLDLLQLIEGSAQTIAVLMGATVRAQGGGPAHGMLVGVAHARLDQDIPAGHLVEAHVSLTYSLPPFSLFTARITVDERDVAQFELQTMSKHVAAETRSPT
jgi:hypothetical protein